jgi:uncharacterized Zn finger protein
MARRRYYGYNDDYDDWRGYFPKSTPLEAKGGIKAQSKRGGFGESWWAKRWIAVLESFQIGARLQRGRSYARRGQVLGIEITKGRVTAEVQGSRPKPYKVTIQVKPLAKADWQKLAKELSRQALFAAKLLAGEMPQDIEQVFQQTKLSLFPKKLGDLSTDCSCPDWSNPCKHIAAVYYLLGEEFDRDPFLIFRLRGIEREELVDLLGGPTEKAAPKKRSKRRSEPEPPLAATEEDRPPSAEPLPAIPEVFWGTGDSPADSVGEVHVPPIAAALPKRLGSLPFWRSGTRFLDAMEAIYTAASPVGMDVLLAQ